MSWPLFPVQPESRGRQTRKVLGIA